MRRRVVRTSCARDRRPRLEAAAVRSKVSHAPPMVRQPTRASRGELPGIASASGGFVSPTHRTQHPAGGPADTVGLTLNEKDVIVSHTYSTRTAAAHRRPTSKGGNRTLVAGDTRRAEPHPSCGPRAKAGRPVQGTAHIGPGPGAIERRTALQRRSGRRCGLSAPAFGAGRSNRGRPGVRSRHERRWCARRLPCDE